MRIRDNDQFAEKWLEAALKQYGASEPRPGLESRVLANLHVEQARLTLWPWWWRPVAAVVTIAIVTGGALLLRQKPDVAGVPISNQPAVATRSQESEAPVASASRPDIKPRLPRRSHSESHTVQPPSEPRLEQFPAPRPLSEQEEMLARYVREQRQEAILVARARVELLKQEHERFLQQSPSEPTDWEQ